MLHKITEDIRIEQNEVESTIVASTEAEEKKLIELTNEALKQQLEAGTISVDDLTDEEILALLEDPIHDKKAYQSMLATTQTQDTTQRPKKSM